MKLPFLCLAALPLLAVPAEAQRAWGGLPPSQWAPDLAAQVPVETLAAPAVAALLAEDAQAPKGFPSKARPLWRPSTKQSLRCPVCPAPPPPWFP